MKKIAAFAVLLLAVPLLAFADQVYWAPSTTTTSGYTFTSAEMATMKYYVRIDKPNPRDAVGSTGWNQAGTWYYVGEAVGVTSWPSNNNLSALFVSYGFAGQAVRITVSQAFNDNGVERDSQLSNVWTWTSDGTPPFVSNFSPASGATGVPDNTTSFSFQYGDTGLYSAGANLSALSVSCPGYAPAAKTCASGGAVGAAPLTCSGTPALYTVTFPGLSLAADNVVTCTITGADLEDPANTLSATYSFTVAAASPVPLSIDTTTLPDARVGVSYTAPILVSGGQPPYVCDNTVGSLPPGIPLASACAGFGPGVPTEAGTYNITLEATDAQGATDTQALSLTVLPAAPGGQFTLTVASDNDTYINQGSPAVNYSTEDSLRAYVWPERVEANTILDKGKTSDLPDNVSLVRSVYRVYQTGYDGAGIDNLVLYVRPVTGTVNPDNVTWENFSGYTGAAVSSTTVRLTEGWVEFDVTAVAQSAYAASKADYLVSIGSGTLGARDQNRIFASSQHSDPAKRPHTVHTYMLLTSEGGDSVPAKGKFRFGPGSNPKHFSCVESPEPLQYSSAVWKIKKYGTRPEIWVEVEQ